MSRVKKPKYLHATVKPVVARELRLDTENGYYFISEFDEFHTHEVPNPSGLSSREYTSIAYVLCSQYGYGMSGDQFLGHVRISVDDWADLDYWNGDNFSFQFYSLKRDRKT